MVDRDAAADELLSIVLDMCRTGFAKRHDPETGKSATHAFTPAEYSRLVVQVWAALDEGRSKRETADGAKQMVERIIFRRGEGTRK
jgi:hypothetical protein